jgi:hypothetical protein
MAAEFRIGFKYKMAIVADRIVGRLENRLGAGGCCSASRRTAMPRHAQITCIRRKREARSLVLRTAIFQVTPLGSAVQLSRTRASAGRWHSVDVLPQLCATEPKTLALLAMGPTHDPGINFKYMERARVYDLRTVNSRHFQYFHF